MVFGLEPTLVAGQTLAGAKAHLSDVYNWDRSIDSNHQT